MIILKRGENNMKSIELKNEVVKLRAIEKEDVEAVFEAGQYAEIWQYMSSKIESPLDAKAYIEDIHNKMAAGNQYAFAIRDSKTNELIGSTRFYNIDEANKSVEIGYTWLTPTVWRSAINTNCKYLLLNYCFEKWGINRVQIVADERNERSCNAIKRIGAVQEGVLRKHMIRADGFVRNSVVFSIIKEEWPQVKMNLQEKL